MSKIMERLEALEKTASRIHTLEATVQTYERNKLPWRI